MQKQNEKGEREKDARRDENDADDWEPKENKNESEEKGKPVEKRFLSIERGGT